MDNYMSDKEQVDMLKKWWSDYGKSILLAVIVGLGLGYGWQYWQKYRAEHKQAASVAFQNIALVSIQDASSKPLLKPVKQLKVSDSGSIYASFAAMLLAAKQVKAGKYQDALAQLQWVIAHASLSQVKDVARIRAAKIEIYLHHQKKAQALLAKVTDPAFSELVASLKASISA